VTSLSKCNQETATDDLRFEHGGGHLIGTLNTQLSTLNSFVWGLVLSCRILAGISSGGSQKRSGINVSTPPDPGEFPPDQQRTNP
jgi:hypothetical protein